MEPKEGKIKNPQSESHGPADAGAGSPKTRWSVGHALTSESFIEKIALLLVTASLTGVIVPMIISHFNLKASERQKNLEFLKARDSSILQSQSKLLDDAAEVILTYQTLALDVSWYKHSRGADEELHHKAFARYSEKIVELVTKWRILISRSRMLASADVSNKLQEFLEKTFIVQDTPIGELVRKKASTTEWEKLHSQSEAMLVDANDLIAELAKDMKLSGTDLNQQR